MGFKAQKAGLVNRGCCAWSEERSDERAATERTIQAMRIKPSFFAYLAVITVAALVVLIVWRA